LSEYENRVILEEEKEGDHAKRTRFYGAMVDSEYLMKGSGYEELPDVYIFYISETDIWGLGHMEYPVKKKFDNTEIEYEDGLHVIYINAAVDDGSEKAELMKYFRTTDPNDTSQGKLSERIHYLKSEDGGKEIMDAVSEEIYGIGREEGREEGRMQTLISKVCKKTKKGNTPEEIADMLEEEVPDIKVIYDVAQKHAPDYNERAIYEELIPIWSVHEKPKYHV